MTLYFGERRKERSQGIRDSISYKAELDIKINYPNVRVWIETKYYHKGNAAPSENVHFCLNGS